jgi:hypothetical protein
MSRVDEIRKRLEAIADWKWDYAEISGTRGCYRIPKANVAEVKHMDDGVDGHTITRPTRDFIAAAPKDISYLLGRVEKLEGLLDRLTRAANQASMKQWLEVDKPAREMQVELINRGLSKESVRLRWAGRYGRKLKGGVQFGTLIRVLGTGMSWRVLADGYTHPQDWHPAFWELAAPPAAERPSHD